MTISVKFPKKSDIILVFLLICSISSFGQRVYAGIEGGVGSIAGRDELGADQTTNIGPPPANSTGVLYTSRPYSLGQGFPVGVYGGYMINKNIGVQLGASYLIGSAWALKNETDAPGYAVIQTITLKSSMIRLTPAFRIETGEKKLHPYAIVGLIIGLAPKVMDDYDSAGVKHTTAIISGGVSWGFHGALGINYLFNKNLGAFAELSGNYQNWTPGKAIVTSSTYNGKDNLSALSASQKEVDYMPSYSVNNSALPTANSPTQASQICLPFSSFGFTIGLHYFFGN
jgi:hypothetical protein